MLESLDLDRVPFGPDSSPDSIFQSSQVQEVERRVLFAVAGNGPCLVTGESGSGKTTGIRQASYKLTSKGHRVLYTPGAGGAFGVLRSLHYALGLKPPHFKADLSQRFVEACSASEESLVVMVDEAQLMNTDGLQQLRLLLNRDFETRPPFVLVLAGCPELREILAQPQMIPLRRRVLTSYQVEGLTEEEARLYLEHHLQRAGARRKLFDAAAVRELYGHSRGNPKTINQLALTALLAAASAGKGAVGIEHIRQAVRELEGRS